MWKRIPHLMQQNETPRKGYKVSNAEFTIIHSRFYNKKLNNNTKDGEHEDWLT